MKIIVYISISFGIAFTGLTQEESLRLEWKKIIHIQDIERVGNVFTKAYEVKQPFEVCGTGEILADAAEVLFRQGPECLRRLFPAEAKSQIGEGHTAVAPVGVAPLAGPAVGQRALDVVLGRGRTLTGLARRPSFTLLGLAATEDGVRPLEGLLAPLGKRFAVALAVRVVGPSVVLAQRYGASGTDRLWLLRPDGYVAVKCAVSELSLLEAWLAEPLVG